MHNLQCPSISFTRTAPDMRLTAPLIYFAVLLTGCTGVSESDDPPTVTVDDGDTDYEANTVWLATEAVRFHPDGDCWGRSVLRVDENVWSDWIARENCTSGSVWLGHAESQPSCNRTFITCGEGQAVVSNDPLYIDVSNTPECQPFKNGNVPVCPDNDPSLSQVEGTVYGLPE